MAQLSDHCEYTGGPVPLPLGAVVDEIDILTHNVFGKTGPVYTQTPGAPDPSECQCDPVLDPDCDPTSPPVDCIPDTEPESYDACRDRLRASGEAIADARYDIVAFQELYDLDTPVYDPNCYPFDFLDTVLATDDYVDDYYWDRPAGDGALVFDGGQGILSRHPTTDVAELALANGLELFPVMGVVFARVWLTDELAIDTYNVHLHSKVSERCDQLCRYQELGELADMIRDISSGSGFPVLVVGDFNIGGPNPEPAPDGQCAGNDWYGDIMLRLGNPRDLWIEGRPGEVGSTIIGSQERIDFVFAIEDPDLTDSDYQLHVSQPRGIDTVQWRVDVQVPFTDVVFSTAVSDHRGIEATLEIRRRLGLAALLAAIL